MSTLLQHATVLYYDNGWQTIQDGYIGIRDETIDYLGSEKPQAQYDEGKDMSLHLVMPGFYNMHTHTGMSILRGIGSALPLGRWLTEAVFPVEMRMLPSDIRAGSRLAIMEMLASGVVSFSDMYHLPDSYVQDVIDIGIKANLSSPIMLFGSQSEADIQAILHKSVDFHHQWHNSAAGRVLVDFAIHAEYTSTPEMVRQYSRMCAENNGRMHLHLSETRSEHEECKQRHGVTPARYFYQNGTFDNPTNAAHCVWVEPDDMDLMRENGVTPVHNPSSNMKLGSGFMPIKGMKERGIRITLGTDSDASNNNQDMVEEIRMASLLHCGFQLDPTIVVPEEVLLMATLNGAAAQGRRDCGNIQVGMKADLIAINLDKPHLLPVHDLPSLIVYSLHAADVDLTMVNGKILYERGEFKTLDFEDVKKELRLSYNRLF
jgi:5-methylthioadenosine/S-adenosylhomocysteine deaminase